jgi:hypothetical protein
VRVYLPVPYPGGTKEGKRTGGRMGVFTRILTKYASPLNQFIKRNGQVPVHGSECMHTYGDGFNNTKLIRMIQQQEINKNDSATGNS